MGRQSRLPAKQGEKRMIEYITLAFVAVHFLVSFAAWMAITIIARAPLSNRQD
jgi:hypothetical protein